MKIFFLNADDKSKKKKDEKDAKGDDESKKLLGETEVVSTLFEVDLDVEEGQLLGVAGPVGAGKSSLVSAIMGEVLKHAA